MSCVSPTAAQKPMPDFSIPLEFDDHFTDGLGRATAVIPEKSAWFDGHFPNNPVLPGIAVLNLAERMILRQAQKKHLKWALIQMDRVRFRRLLRPGDRIVLKASVDYSNPGASHRFEVFSDNESVCAGSMRFAEAER